MKNTNPMRRIYNSKPFWVIVSLLASLAIWVYVSSEDSNEFQQTFRGVRVELLGEDTLRQSKNMVITDLSTNTVTVEVVGPRRIVGSLDPSDLTAVVDVSKLSQAAYTAQQYSIDFSDNINKKNLTVSAKTPDTVSFVVSELASKTIQVRGSFNNSPAPGYTAETPVFDPATITVTGPEAYINRVSYAWVEFGKEGVTTTYSQDVGVTLMDENGEACSTAGISLSTDTVKATLPILEVKEVKLGVNVIEGAGATGENTKITVDPASVTLVGDSSILEGMNKIILDTIDLTDFVSTYTEVYTIPLDNDVRSYTGVTEATVTVEIMGLSTKTFSVTNFERTNVTAGYEAEILSKSIDVVLRGTEEQLGQIKSANIRAVADLKDYVNSTGSYMPEVKIYVDGFTDVGALGTNSISVEIRKVQG